jgi:glycosyltransferase involved in cell wall biosynthesis
MRFHVLSLPHTQTTKDYSWCAYTEKVRKFCNMMYSLGHEVYLYASEDNEAECTELITCIKKSEQPDGIPHFAPDEPHFQLMNGRAIGEMAKRLQPKDFICLIGGLTQKVVADAFPKHMSVEFGIGYGGVFSPYKVFESYAWMHTVYGTLQQDRNAHAIDGQFFDTVIPNYFEVDDFPLGKKKDDYYLFMGRLIERKGWRVAQEVCEKLGKRLIVAGSGEFSGYGEYAGSVDPEERGKLMSKAKAVFVPTIYIEPFGGVAVEAMICGTPVITTDWGAFTETVKQNVTGFRCRTFAEFLKAVENADQLDYENIRRYAVDNFSTEVIKYEYQKYFERLLTLWDKGWYQL